MSFEAIVDKAIADGCSTERSDLESYLLAPKDLDKRFEDFEIYTSFATNFIPPVIGLINFHKNKLNHDYSSEDFLVSASDEAFAVLTYDNNYERWLDMAIHGNRKESAVPTKYTTSAEKRKNKYNVQETSKAKRYQGWSIEGINKYNDLYMAVVAFRSTPQSKEWDKCFKDYYEDQDKEKNSNKRKRKVEQDFEFLPLPCHQLFKGSQTSNSPAEEPLQTDGAHAQL